MSNKFNHLIFCCFLSYFGFAQKVSDATSRQEQSNIIVSYYLETTSPCNISLYLSTDGGKNWTGPLKKVKGDVGNKVFGGDYKIEWSVLEEYNELIGDNIKFQVRAESNLAESNLADFGTIKIGSQIWSATNLNVSRYRNGDEIPEVQDIETWSKLTTGAWCYYENKTENGDKYGKLYNWYAVNDPRGLAPTGWHVPTNDEWNLLTKFIDPSADFRMCCSNVAGTAMKSTTGWAGRGNGTNSSGFAGFNGGYRNYNGAFTVVDYYGFWWGASANDTTSAWYRYLSYSTSSVGRNHNNKANGFSVRLVRD